MPHGECRNFSISGKDFDTKDNSLIDIIMVKMMIMIIIIVMILSGANIITSLLSSVGIVHVVAVVVVIPVVNLYVFVRSRMFVGMVRKGCMLLSYITVIYNCHIA